MSKQVNEIVIRVSGDSDIQSTLDQLTKVGKIDSDNARTFKENAQKNKDTLGKSKGDFEKFTDSVKGVGLALGIAFSVEQIIEFGKKMLESFRENEKSLNSLRFAVTRVGNEGGAALQKLVTQSERLQKVSIFSDGAIRNAQTQLATYGLTSKQIEALTPKILDLASASGIDLAQATDKVINGINGQTKGLKDVGIAFEDTGSKTENFSILTEKLTKFQGATASALNTSAGAALNLENRFDSLLAKGGAFVDEQIKRTKELAIQYEDLFTKGVDAATQGKAERAQMERLGKRNDEILKVVGEGDKKLAGQEALAAKKRIELDEYFITERSKRILDLKAGRSEEEFQASLSAEEKEEIAGQRRFIKDQKIERDFDLKLLQDINAFYDEKDRIVEDATLKGIADAEAEAAKKAAKLQKLADEAAAKEKKDAQEHADFVRGALDQELKYRIESLKGRDEAEKQIAIQSINTRIELGIATREEIDALYEYEKEVSDKKIEALRKEYKERQEIQDAFTKYRIESLTNADKEERKIAIQAIKDRIALGTATKEEIDALAAYQKKINDTIKDQLQGTLNGIGKIFDEVESQRDASLQHQMELERSFIENQTNLAIAGKDNTLAVEEKKMAELEKQRAQNQRKLKREKELQAFLEAVISYNKEDPKTSIIKALAQVAGIEGASALFGEDAGLIGSNMPKTHLGRGGRRHRSGKDRLLLAEDGEGMFSRKNIRNLGGPERFMALKRRLDAGPLGEERRIPIERAMPAREQSQEVVGELREIKQQLKDNPRYEIDWESKADMDNMNITRIEKGVKDITKIQLRRPRIG